MTSLAADAAIAALGDPEYDARSREANARERQWLAERMRALGATVVPSAANFILFATRLASADLAERLLRRHHVVVRDCASYATLEGGGYLRAGVRSRRENRRLLEALDRELSDS